MLQDHVQQDHLVILAETVKLSCSCNFLFYERFWAFFFRISWLQPQLIHLNNILLSAAKDFT